MRSLISEAISERFSSIPNLFYNFEKKEKYSRNTSPFFVVPEGFEPSLTEPESGVLPLHNGTIKNIAYRLSTTEVVEHYTFFGYAKAVKHSYNSF